MTVNPVLLSRTAVAAAFAAGAMGLWLASRSVGVRGLPGCGAGSGCAAITRGRWSRVGPIPVAVLGAAAYLALLLAACNRAGWLGGRDPARDAAGTVVALIAVAAAAWFTLLQVFVIRRLCAYCMTVHMLACIAAVPLLLAQRPWATPAWPTELGIAMACVAGLAVGQVLLVPKTFAVTRAPAPTGELAGDVADVAVPRAATNDAVVSRGNGVQIAPATPRLAVVAAAPPSQRRVRLLGGQVVLNVGGWPLVGQPDAAHVVAVLFDFTCSECHHLRRLLAAAVEERSGWLAVALVPVPLNPACNPSFKCARNARLQACEYARLAWAVWLADIDRYAEWDRYVTAEAEGQPYGLALLRAKELVDLSRFRLPEPHPALDRAVATGVGLYQASGKPKVPAVLLPSGVLQGHMPDLAALMRILDAHLPSTSELAHPR